MGQFKPMVKMETTEPSVILKLKKGGHVAVNKDENGHTNMKGAGFKAKYSEEACEGESPKKPSVADRRKAMSGAMLNSKKGGKVEKKAMGGPMGTPAMAAPATPVGAPMDPRKAALMRTMRGRRPMGAPVAPVATPVAASGMPAMKKGGKADDKAQDKAMIAKAMKQHDAQEHTGGKGTKLKLATGGLTNPMKKGGKVNTSKADPGYERYATGGVVNGMATGGLTNPMKKGGAAKKHFATGGSVETGHAVAMPKRPVSKPVSNTNQSGTFKKGGKVDSELVDASKGAYDRSIGPGEDEMEVAKAFRDPVGSMKKLLGVDSDSAAGAGRGVVNPPLVRKQGGRAKR